MSEFAVKVDGLVKDYAVRGGGTLRAVDGISFEVKTGEIFGFLGPNGAGKTTTLEIVEGLTARTAGTVEVLGLDPDRDAEALKSRIGIQLQSSAYFDFLTLREVLELFGAFYPRAADPMELLARVDLTEKADALVSQLSGGQQQRFSIAATLVNEPEVVFLDEATTGLDPRARRDLWDMIRAIRADGTTVVLTTHYMEEAEILCDRVAIIDQGVIVASDTVAGLLERVPPTSLEPVIPTSTLEDVFLSLTGKSLAAAEPVEGDV